MGLPPCLQGPSAELRDRAKRFSERMAAWSARVRPAEGSAFYAAVAPLALPRLFDTALRVFPDHSEGPHYVLRAERPFRITVHLNAGSWRWHDTLGTVGSRGLVALWSWRMDVECVEAWDVLTGLLGADLGAGVAPPLTNTVAEREALAFLAHRRAAAEARRAALLAEPEPAGLSA